MVVSGGQPIDCIKRQINIGSGGLPIGGPGGLTLGGGGNNPQASEGTQAGAGQGDPTNKMFEGIVALEGAKNNTGGGLSIGGLTLDGPGGGITVKNGDNEDKGQLEGQPAAPPPTGGTASTSTEGQPAAFPAAGEAAKEPGQSAALQESQPFDDNADITTDRDVNAANLGGDLGITKGSDGSTSVGGESGIHIIPRAVGAAPAVPPPIQVRKAGAVPSIPAAPAALSRPSSLALPKVASAAPAPLAAASKPPILQALPSALAPAAAQSVAPLPAVLPASPGQVEAPALVSTASASPTGTIPKFIPGTTPSV
jgi:hypothetical protein